MSVENPQQRSALVQGLQQLNESTHGWVSVNNAVDFAAFPLAIHAASRFDTWPGIIEGAVGFSADIVDGPVARWLGTTSEVGAKLDAGGDKVKVLYALMKIWQNEQAPRPLIAAVAAQNLANTALTLADRAFNQETQLDEVSIKGKKAMLLQVGGIGLNVIGTRLNETKPAAGKALKASGIALSTIGLVSFGRSATAEYYQRYRNGKKKPWVRKLFGHLADVVEQA